MSDAPEGLATVSLRILTPEGVLYEGAVDWVQAPLEDGLIGIWPGHAPLVGAVARGRVRFATGGEQHEMAVGEGVLRVDEEGCAILVGALLSMETPAEEEQQDEIAARLEEALYDAMAPEEIEELQQAS